MTRATSRPAPTINPAVVPCIRCGLERRAGGHTKPLCRHCAAVMTPNEREVWAA